MKQLHSCLLLLLTLTLCLFLTSLAAAEGSVSISAPDGILIGESIPLTVSGLTSGEQITLCLLDSQGRYLWGGANIVENESLTLTVEGREYIDLARTSGTWTLQMNTDTAQCTCTLSVTGNRLMASAVTLLSSSISETGGTAVVQLADAAVDQLMVTHAFFTQAGQLAGNRTELVEVSGAQALLSAPEAAQYGWSVFVNCCTDGRWSALSPILYIPGQSTSDLPTVTVQASASLNPAKLTVTAPGWEGSGYMTAMTIGDVPEFVYWGLSFQNGTVTVNTEPHYVGISSVRAVLTREGKPVAWSAPIEITFTDGMETAEHDYYMVSASVSGSRKAGEPLSLNMSTPDGMESFSVSVTNSTGTVVYQNSSALAQTELPVWVFNQPGTYRITCGKNPEKYLDRTLSVSISENTQPPVPVIGEELVERGSFSYLSLLFPGEGTQTCYYYEIVRVDSEWSSPSYSSPTPTDSILLRADMYRAGTFRIRLCQVRDGVCSPWAVTTYRYGIPEDTVLVVDAPDTVTFGTDYTISTPTALPGYSLWLRITDKTSSEIVYDELDRLGTCSFQMDGSLLPEGEYTAYLFTLEENFSGSKDFTVVGEGPVKPTLTADVLLLTQPGNVTFTILAPGADSFYLSEGGYATDSYPVTDGVGEFTASFNQYKSGTYEFRARAQKNGVNSLWSDPVTITVRVTLPEDHVWSDVTYTWNDQEKTLTASRYSLADETIVETETTQAGRIVVKSPTETAEGTWQWISDSFTNPAFTAQQGESGIIPALSSMNVLRLPEGVTTLEAEALSNTACQAILVPSGCTNVDQRVFSDNPNLIYLRLPNTLEIPYNAIANCPNLVIDWISD